MGYSSSNNNISNLSEKLYQDIQNKINKQQLLVGDTTTRGGSFMRDGLLNFGALPMKNIKETDYAGFGWVGFTVGP